MSRKLIKVCIYTIGCIITISCGIMVYWAFDDVTAYDLCRAGVVTFIGMIGWCLTDYASFKLTCVNCKERRTCYSEEPTDKRKT